MLRESSHPDDVGHNLTNYDYMPTFHENLRSIPHDAVLELGLSLGPGRHFNRHREYRLDDHRHCFGPYDDPSRAGPILRRVGEG